MTTGATDGYGRSALNGALNCLPTGTYTGARTNRLVRTITTEEFDKTGKMVKRTVENVYEEGYWPTPQWQTTWGGALCDGSTK